MKRVVPIRIPARYAVAVCAFVALMLAAACMPDANVSIISPELGQQLAALEAGQSIVREPTPVPPMLAELTPEEIFAGVPEELASLIQTAEPSAGAGIALVPGDGLASCTGCHLLDASVMAAGPTWFNIGDTAVDHALRAGSPGPAAYLHESIVAPNAWIVPGYVAGIMPEIYGEALSDEDLATLIAYLLSLNGQP